MSAAHSTRAHSKFSASGSERWLNCAASVELEEGLEGKSSPWAEEGTTAHEVLETLFKMRILPELHKTYLFARRHDRPMVQNALKMIDAVYDIRKTLVEPELLIEVRVHNNEIHPEMFGTVDAALVEIFGTLHVFDYKYGQGHVVSPEKNTQMIQYALGLAEKYDWQFTDVVVHICQPRAGKNWHKQWKITIEELKGYRELWRKGVARVDRGGNKPFAGNWCHWCKANDGKTCPAKREKQTERVNKMFSDNPLTIGDQNGFKKSSSQKGSEESYQKENGKKGDDYETLYFAKGKEKVKKVNWEEI